ncbi:hypothetical protein BK054_13605 [Myroides sp. ZB35]|uniref:Uncharacterized protein n=1 Tax=Myroides odoratimimus TaxID=76832 RepID=A0AAI8G5Y1_9FLAO|nr:hypothetical protein AS202_14055 [Myroides odoratimimus]APA93241.1 hypothetical protein BK054_13605 [Myroides sp. ZB35]
MDYFFILLISIIKHKLINYSLRTYLIFNLQLSINYDIKPKYTKQKISYKSDILKNQMTSPKYEKYNKRTLIKKAYT